METTSISEIKKLKDAISLNLDIYKNYLKTSSIDMANCVYGSEREYSINGLIAGAKNILTDISYLVKSHNVFVKISTSAERVNVQTNLAHLNSYIKNKQHTNIATSIDQLKTRIDPKVLYEIANNKSEEK